MVSADDGYEPPTNSYLANSPWPMSHRNPYCQGSSPLRGPEASDTLGVDFSLVGMAPITLNFSAPYPDGKQYIRASSVTNISKADPNGDHVTVLAWGSDLRGLYRDG
ncbi:MAG: hypothetical protein HF978_00450 [Desulfobacteraceae bacterium]|nr:hypothetical protein [Desulfobacteraceae bacterium]MBC2754004.1 hypothetical protein [Desulfobacteraceae bacterium]